MKAMTPEEKEIGQANYYEAVGVSRRDMLKGVVASGAVTMGGLGAAYFNYGPSVENPVRVGVIGTGDEGGVLIGAINPNYIQVVAVSDIRPYNIHRAFHGDWGGSKPEFTHSIRTGLVQKYDWSGEDQARENVKVYQDYIDLINDPNVEAVIIALPLFLHAEASIRALQAGKHVLTEKLMAHNVAQCKVMSRVAEESGKYLATGHQRHYSVLYDNAVNLIQWGVLGQVHHIRAQWHRGNLPGRDSWQPPLPGGERVWETKSSKWVQEDRILKELKSFKKKLDEPGADIDMLNKKIAQWEQWNADRDVVAKDYGYQDLSLDNGRERSALEELCRWRLWQRTGGGLMAELGSHQLDAASIFISALHNRGKSEAEHVHVQPLSVHAVGGRHVFAHDRDADDHVYCMFEFPAPHYEAGFDAGYRDKASNIPDPVKGIPGYSTDPNNKKIVVTYSSINGNGFGGYGEIVMGSKGTLVLEREQEVMLYRTDSTSSRIRVKNDKGGPVLDTQASGGPTAAASVAKAADGPISRGYTEEMEHWAWLIRNADPKDTDVKAQPRCRPEVAMGDGIIALTCNVAIQRSMRGESGYIQFKDEWFDIHSDETPDGSEIAKEKESLKA